MKQPSAASKAAGKTTVLQIMIRKLRKGHVVVLRVFECFKGKKFYVSQNSFRDADPYDLAQRLGVPYNPTPQRRRVVDEILAATAAEKQEAA